jgi:uncharacterized protein
MKNAVNWFEINTENFDRAKEFYEKILKQQIKEEKLDEQFKGMRMGFFNFDMESGVGGSIMYNPLVKPSSNGTVVYLNVDGDMDGVLSRITSSGGKICMPKTEIPPHGTIALFNDTEGNLVGLHSK